MYDGAVAVDERELILELFPGTDPALLPPGEVLYYREGERVVIEEAPFRVELVPLPRPPLPRPAICEACGRPLGGAYARFFRLRVPGEGAEVFRYVVLCEDTETCRERARPEVLRRILRKGILP